MKIVHTVLLALSFSFFAPVLISSSAQAQEYDCYAPEDDAQTAVCNLLGRARLAYNSVSRLPATPEANDAKRYARNIINGCDRLATLLFNYGSEQAIQAEMEYLQTSVYQLDASSRELKSLYPKDTKLSSNLNAVRGTYLALEDLLLSVDE